MQKGNSHCAKSATLYEVVVLQGKANWSEPVAYDLTRTLRRASVPKDFEDMVPETPGTYAIYCLHEVEALKIILDIGECGPRPSCKPHGLKGRLATGVAHSASQRIALDVLNGRLGGDLRVVWFQTESKALAKITQDVLVSLFRRDYRQQPRYNTKWENYDDQDAFEAIYNDLKALTGCSW